MADCSHGEKFWFLFSSPFCCRFCHPTLLNLKSGGLRDLFYSQSCGHCRELINDHWPPIQTEFGDQLRVLFINIDDKQGVAFKRETEAFLGIPSSGVPMLVIGEEVMAGSRIAEQSPTVIRAGLEAGGVDFPDIPGIEQLYQDAVEQNERGKAERDSYGPTAAFSPVAVIDNSLTGRLAADPVANALAILILVLLVVSLLKLAVTSWRSRVPHDPELPEAISGQFRRGMLALLSLIGLILTLSLAAGWNNQPVILLLAGGEFVIFLISLLAVFRSLPAKSLSGWLVAAAGAGRAGRRRLFNLD